MTPEIFEQQFERMRAEIAKAVVGQPDLVFGLLVALVAQGHVLIEGAPGLGKTLVARAVSQSSGLGFKRVQFTPDLMPSDITGSSIYEREKGSFTFVPGPIFTQLLLADEINRAPAKTQSALLEAMQEGQVTVDGVTRMLPAPFLVVATQNPVESQGTYPLPEAQLDRFLFKLTVQDPPLEVEIAIVRKHASGFDPMKLAGLVGVETPEGLEAMHEYACKVQVRDEVTAYMVDLVRRTRSDVHLELGASPRASISLLRASQVVAAAAGRDFVTPDDVKSIARPVLRHRVMLHPDAELQGISVEDRIEEILRSAPVPREASA
jgi:MoxR-like ATPase